MADIEEAEDKTIDESIKFAKFLLKWQEECINLNRYGDIEAFVNQADLNEKQKNAILTRDLKEIRRNLAFIVL
jgi:hypothetical protein